MEKDRTPVSQVAVVEQCAEIADRFVKNNKGSSNPQAFAAYTVASEIAKAIRALSAMSRDEPHPDDIAVDRFAAAMKAKLAKKRDEGRGGWENKGECSAEYLSQLLREHVDKGDPVDVGNLAMMIQQRGESICVLTERVAALSQLHAIVDAWEALPGGRQVRNSDVEDWLGKHMGPGIDAIRGFLRRPRPDGILPPAPSTQEGAP